MAITTKESLSGFIASDPDLTFTSNGDARLYARVGQPQARREEDGSFTKLEPTFTDLVMFRKSAERAHAQFQKGDNFIAEGDVHHYPQTVDGVEGGEGAVRRFPDRSRQQHDHLRRRPPPSRAYRGTRHCPAGEHRPGPDRCGGR